MTLEALRQATNHFERLGLPVVFDLDPATLQSRYIEAARLTHPDLADADEQSQAQAMEQSAAVNDACRILSDPAQRAEYLLQLQGRASPADNRALPDGFLDHVLSLREQLTEVAAAGDKDAVASLLAGVSAEAAQRLVAIADGFRGGDAEAAGYIRLQLNALRYLQRMLQQH